MTIGMVWSVVAGATANYVYYWHCREHIAAIKQQAWNDPSQQHATIKEEGGVQPYVIWVGVVFYLLFSLAMFKMLQEGTMDTERAPKKSAAPAGHVAGINAAFATSSRPETSSSPARTPLPPNQPLLVFVPIGCRCAASFSATSS